jgi:hypothetical protein
MAKIKSELNSTAIDERISFTDEDGKDYEFRVLATDGGECIGNQERADGTWFAVQVADFGDGDADVYEADSGDHFTSEFGPRWKVESDEAGSLKWIEIED